ncbi:hypothetical protein PVAP13_4KG372700 [Panicum virgatum]|uniref:Uncharacterized protein n=1 Tax=Panicum virgatum TaxID=38727 RepID=A0A8T0TSJ8_PANVG|nr:hypothetical protein PVAP13_4KG372700 [Panicum virgatum]
MDVAGSLTANREEGGGGAGGRGRTGDHPGRPSCLCASRGRCTGGWGAASQWSRDLSNHLICSPKLYFSSPRVTLGACFCVSGLLGHWYVGILKKYRLFHSLLFYQYSTITPSYHIYAVSSLLVLVVFWYLQYVHETTYWSLSIRLCSK